MSDSEMLDWLQEFGVAIFESVNEEYYVEYIGEYGEINRTKGCSTLRECILSVAKEIK